MSDDDNDAACREDTSLDAEELALALGVGIYSISSSIYSSIYIINNWRKQASS